MAKKSAPDTAEPSAPRLDDITEVVDTIELDNEVFVEDVVVRGTDLTSQNATRASIERCRLERVVLMGVELPRLRLLDVTFADCDLSGSWLTQVEALRVTFARCRIGGAVLSDGSWRDVRFTDCKLEGANLRNSRFERVTFERCGMKAIDFYGASIAGGRVFECDLAGAELSKADFRQVRLQGSNLAELRGALQLAGATITSTQAGLVGLQLLNALNIKVKDDDSGDG